MTTRNERFTKRMYRYASFDRLLLMRNLSYGSAAASLVILLALIQIGAKNTFIQVSTISISASLPLWMLLGGIYEYYIFLGKESYPHFRKKSTLNFVGAVLFFAGLGMITSLGCMLWFLMPESTYIFGAACLISIVIFIAFHASIQSWWFSSEGPEPEEKIKHG